MTTNRKPREALFNDGYSYRLVDGQLQQFNEYKRWVPVLYIPIYLVDEFQQLRARPFEPLVSDATAAELFDALRRLSVSPGQYLTEEELLKLLTQRGWKLESRFKLRDNDTLYATAFTGCMSTQQVILRREEDA